MASWKSITSNRIIVLGKASKETVKIAQELVGGAGLEISSEHELPLTSQQSNCTLVVLDSQTQPLEKLRSLVTQGSNNKVILNLEDVNLAKLSNDTTHDLYWIASKDPVSLLGILLDRFQGAYWRGSDLVVSISNSFQIFHRGSKTPMTPSETTSVLASVLVACLFGMEERLIQKNLDTAKNETHTRYTEAL